MVKRIISQRQHLPLLLPHLQQHLHPRLINPKKVLAKIPPLKLIHRQILRLLNSHQSFLIIALFQLKICYQTNNRNQMSIISQPFFGFFQF